LDVEIITDLTREKDFSDKPINNLTDATSTMKRLALTQLSQVVAFEVFKELGLEKVHFDMSAIKGDPSDIASGLWLRLRAFKGNLRN